MLLHGGGGEFESLGSTLKIRYLQVKHGHEAVCKCRQPVIKRARSVI